MKNFDVGLLSENIDRIAEYDFERNKNFGAAYCVYQEGKFRLEKYYGSRSAYKNEPVKDTTIFRLASMTKPITAFAALILVDRGLLSLDDTVDKFIPEFKDIMIIDGTDDIRKPVHMPTVRNILSHSSGIASYYDALNDMTDLDRASLDNSVAYYLKKGLYYEPGTRQMYSGSGSFDVLTKIIETVSGTDGFSFVKNEILDPCEMYNTTISPTLRQKERIIKMHCIQDGKNAEKEMNDNCVFENFPNTHYLGGAGLASDMRDYCRFAEMLLNQGKTGDKALVSEETFVQYRTPQVPCSIMGGLHRWGLGVRVVTKEEYPYLPTGSFGWSGAYGTHFWVDPKNRLYAVYMKNSTVDGGAGNESAVNFERAVYENSKIVLNKSSNLGKENDCDLGK